MEICKPDMIYLDSACVSLRTQEVLDSIMEYYTDFPSCHGRSPHKLAQTLTKRIASSRKTIQKYIGAKKPEQIVFTRNTTEAINLVASHFIGKRILTTNKEHNSNLIPWLKDCSHEHISHTATLTEWEQMITTFNPDLIAIHHVSNIDGIEQPIEKLAKLAKKYKVQILVDGAQAIMHAKVSVKNIDYYAFSGHKCLGPSGIGVLYSSHFDTLNQFMVGGETVLRSTLNSYEPAKPPEKFEAGLQDYSGIIGLETAILQIKKYGIRKIQKEESILLKRVQEILYPLIESEKIKIIGQSGSIFNFYIPGKDSHEVALLLSKTYNIAVRSGAHCVHSYYDSEQLQSSVRASFAFYNTIEEIEQFGKAVLEICEL